MPTYRKWNLDGSYDEMYWEEDNFLLVVTEKDKVIHVRKIYGGPEIFEDRIRFDTDDRPLWAFKDA